MTTEEKFTYYSRHFNIVCEKVDGAYRLTALLNPGPSMEDGPILIGTTEDLEESELADRLEELKEKVYIVLGI